LEGFASESVQGNIPGKITSEAPKSPKLDLLHGRIAIFQLLKVRQHDLAHGQDFCFLVPSFQKKVPRKMREKGFEMGT